MCHDVCNDITLPSLGACDGQGVAGAVHRRRMMTAYVLPPCPACGSTNAVRIVYGYPDPELSEAAGRGEVALGGCVIGPESPAYECRACGAPLPWIRPDD